MPGGDWAGTEADWKAKMKAKGLDPKLATRKTIEVPTGKKELMEFLTFYNVDVCRLPVGEPQPTVDVEALRAQHNPGAVTVPPMSAEELEVASHGPITPTPVDLDQLFGAAPVSTQLRLAVQAIDRADAVIAGR